MGSVLSMTGESMNWMIAGCHCCGSIYHVIGGSGASGAEFSDNDQFKTSSEVWSSKTSLPGEKRTTHGTVNVGGTVFNFAGQGETTSFLDDNDSYVIDTWTSKTAVPLARNDVSVGVIGDYAYCISGMYTSPVVYTDQNEEYSPTGDSWATKTVMPTPVRRASSMQFSIDDGVFECCGSNAGNLSDVDKYESSGDAWAAKADSPTGRAAGAGLWIEDKGYLVGGTSGTLVTQYDPSGDSWATKTSISHSSVAGRGCGVDGLGYVCGGSNLLNYHDFYDPVGDTWTATTGLISPARLQNNAVAI